MSGSIKIRPKSSGSRYVALDARKKSSVIAEGRTVASVVRKADKTDRDYSIMYIPPKDKTFIF